MYSLIDYLHAAAGDYLIEERATSSIPYSCVYPFHLIAPIIIVPECYVSLKLPASIKLPTDRMTFLFQTVA